MADDEKRIGNQERWQGQAGDVTMLGKVKRNEDRTSEADKQNNAEHERVLRELFDKKAD